MIFKGFQMDQLDYYQLLNFFCETKNPKTKNCSTPSTTAPCRVSQPLAEELKKDWARHVIECALVHEVVSSCAMQSAGQKMRLRLSRASATGRATAKGPVKEKKNKIKCFYNQGFLHVQR